MIWIFFYFKIKRKNDLLQNDGSIELLQKTYGETTLPLERKSTRTGTYRQVSQDFEFYGNIFFSIQTQYSDVFMHFRFYWRQ